MVLSATQGQHALAVDRDVVGVTLDTTGSILATHAVGYTLLAHPGDSVAEEAHPAVVDTGTALLELGEGADGRVGSCNAPSEGIGFKTIGAPHHAHCLVVEEAVGADSLADIVPVLVLAELALVGPGALGLGGWIEGEALEAVEAVGGGSGAFSAGRLAEFTLAVEGVVGGRTSADAGIEVQVAQRAHALFVD